MSAFLPVAGVSISILMLMAIGTVVGFLSGLLGVGGGVLLTPILMMIGIRPSIAAASGVNAIVATSSSGLAAHFRLGNVDLKLGTVLLVGGMGGASLGVLIIKVLRALGTAGFAITVTYIVVLGASGIYMFIDGLKRLKGGSVVGKPHGKSDAPSFLQRLPFQMNFPASGVRHSILLPISLCTFVGILTAIMGVGGGFLVVPLMTGLLGVPVRVAVGTSLFQILFTSADTTLMQAIENHTVDLVMALLLALGSTVGAQIGARVSKFLRGEQLLILLAALALAITMKMTLGIFMTPSSLLDPVPSLSPHADKVLKEGLPPHTGGVEPRGPTEYLSTGVMNSGDGHSGSGFLAGALIPRCLQFPAPVMLAQHPTHPGFFSVLNSGSRPATTRKNIGKKKPRRIPPGSHCWTSFSAFLELPVPALL